MADDDDVPPGFAAPAAATATAPAPAPAAAAATSAAADELAASVGRVKVDAGDNAPDAPDLSLRLGEGLVNPETEIKSVTQDAIYDSAKRFEDLPLSPELLKVRCWADALALDWVGLGWVGLVVAAGGSVAA